MFVQPKALKSVKKMCHQSTAKTCLSQKNQKKKKKEEERKSTHWITFSFSFASLSRRLRQAMWSEWMWGSQCSVSGRRSLCHPHRGTERLMVWWSTGAADWFRQYLDTKHKSLSGSHSTLAMIAQMQLPSFNSGGNRSTTVPAEHENSPTIFIGFRSMQCCVRYIALSLTTSGAVCHPQWFLTSPHDPRSSLVIGSEIDVSSILFRELVLPLVPPNGHCDVQLWTSLPELWVSRKGEKKPHVQILQFCSVCRIELQAETQQMGHLTEHRERTNLTATMPTCTLNLHLTGTNTH